MELASQKWGTILICLIIMRIDAIPSPGLLRVPKVYNALITSDQNLEPSRAYPVIQPVIHQTSIGYVPNCITCSGPPPFYYPQIGPGLNTPNLLGIQFYTPPGTIAESDPPRVSDRENPDSEPVEMHAKNVDNRSSLTEKEKEHSTDDESKANGTNKQRVPLNFYPNYQSLYYNPYFYGYNPYPHITPGTYYFNYHPHGPLVPVPPPPPPFSSAQPQPSSIRSASPKASSSSIKYSQIRKLEKDKLSKVENL